MKIDCMIFLKTKWRFQSESYYKHLGASLRILENVSLCERAGYVVIFIETFEIDQSKIAIKEFSDFLLLLIFLGVGDRLSGIKKGFNGAGQYNIDQ